LPALLRHLPASLLAALLLTALIVVGLALSASAHGAPVQAQQAAGEARIRLVYAGAAAEPLDLFVNGTRALTNATTFNVGAYLPLPAGTYTLQLVSATLPLTASLLTSTLVVSEDASYSLVAGGAAQATAPASAPLTLTALRDDNVAPPFGLARLRVAHFAPNLGPLALQIDGTTVLTEVAFANAPALDLPGGNYSVTLGLQQNESFVPLLAQRVNLFRGQVVTLWARGLPPATLPAPAPGDIFSATTTVDEAYTRVRGLHASPDALPVDIYVDDQRIVQGISYFDASAYQEQLPAGRYVVSAVAPPGAPITGNVIVSRTLTLCACEPYDLSLALLGTLATTDSVAPAIGFIRDIVTQPRASNGRVSFVHVAPDAPPLDVRIDGTLVYTNVGYRDIENYTLLQPGSHTISLAPVGGAPLLTTTIELTGGESTTLWASGLLTTTTSQTQLALETTRENVALIAGLNTFAAGPPVDVYIDGTLVAEQLGFGERGAYLPVREGTRAVSVTVAATGQVLAADVLTFTASGRASIALLGVVPTPSNGSPAPKPQLELVADEIFLPPPGPVANLRFVNLSGDALSVQTLGVRGATVRLDGIAALASSDAVVVPAGLLPVTITDTTGAVLSSTLAIAPGAAVTVYALPSAAGSTTLRTVVDRTSQSLIALPLVTSNPTAL
jgi:hypothetical protein